MLSYIGAQSAHSHVKMLSAMCMLKKFDAGMNNPRLTVLTGFPSYFDTLAGMTGFKLHAMRH